MAKKHLAKNKTQLCSTGVNVNDTVQSTKRTFSTDSSTIYQLTEDVHTRL